MNDYLLSMSTVSGQFSVYNQPPSNGINSVLQSIIAISSTNITWTAVPQTDTSGVLYDFTGTAGNSGWIASSTYTYTGLTPNTSYTAMVTA